VHFLYIVDPHVTVNNINTESAAMEMQKCFLFGTAVELKLL